MGRPIMNPQLSRRIKRKGWTSEWGVMEVLRIQRQLLLSLFYFKAINPPQMICVSILKVSFMGDTVPLLAYYPA